MSSTSGMKSRSCKYCATPFICSFLYVTFDKDSKTVYMIPSVGFVSTKKVKTVCVNG